MGTEPEMSRSIRTRARDASRQLLGPERTVKVATAYDDTSYVLDYVASKKGRDSLRRLRAMKNQYRGERCFIIGNGPSLRKMDLEPLRNEYTFGMNRLYLLFEELGFGTTFMVATAKHVIDQFADDIFATGSTVFLSHRNSSQISQLPSNAMSVLARRKPVFGDDPLRWGFWDGGTVTYMSMQLANYLGFSRAILIGVDHSFATKGPAAKVVTSEGADPNHFHPEYFGKGVKWELPDLDMSEVAYELARRGYAARGKSIVDATVDGKLTIFPKVRYEDVLAGRA